MMLIVLGSGFVLSIYLLAKGVELLARYSKGSDPNRANQLMLGAMLSVLGLGVGLGCLFWMWKR